MTSKIYQNLMQVIRTSEKRKKEFLQSMIAQGHAEKDLLVEDMMEEGRKIYEEELQKVDIQVT